MNPGRSPHQPARTPHRPPPSLVRSGALILLLACSGDGPAAPTPQPPALVPTSVTIAPDSLMLEPGDTATLAATVRDQNGTAMAGAAVTWSSSAEGVATVSASALVTATGSGAATITATSGAASGKAAVAVQRTPFEIALAPGSLAFAALGDTARLSATVLDRRGEVIEDAPVTWSSGDSAVASVDSLGLVASAGNGSATVTARAEGGVEGAASVVVNQVPVGMAVEPAQVVFYEIGETATLAAVVHDANGHAIAGARASWTSDDRSVVTVTPEGAVTAAGFGATVVRAASGALAASAEASVVPPSPERDRQVLIELYESAGGDGWLNSRNWVTDAPLSSWDGVQTDAEGYVTHLWLVFNELSGSLPPSLGRLRRLEELLMYSNRIGGSIPAELGQLRRLKKLILSDNELTGEIPAAIGELAALEELMLASNALSGPLPDALGGLTELRMLWLQRNDLTGPLPAELGRLAALEELVMHGNQLSGTIPPELGDLGNLVKLELNGPYPHVPGTGLSGAIPPELGRLASLQQIRLDRNRLTGEIPPELGDLGSLDRLQLFENQLTGPIPPELGRLDNLALLSIGWNRLSGPIPPELANMSSLVVMNFGGPEMRLSGSIPPELGGMERLRDLVLFQNRLSGRVPEELGDLSTLQWLELSRNPGLEGLLPRSLMKLNLRYLTLDETGLCAHQDAAFREWQATIATVWIDDDCTPRQIERLALNELHDRTGGASWTTSTGWGGDGPVEDWHGVTTGGGRVTGLALADNGLAGPIPGDLANFTELSVLNLSGNALTGPLPPEIARFSGLTELRVGGNAGLEGPLDYDLMNLGALQVLHFGGTALCASPAPTFQAWYRGVADVDGAVCGNPDEVRLDVPVAYLAQSVQTPERSVRLVEGRDALLRVFVTGDPAPAFFEPEVAATVAAGGREHRVLMTRAGDRLLTSADESSLAHSYNAVIPGSFVVPGATLVVEADPGGVVPHASGSRLRFPAAGAVPLDVVAVPEMEVTVVPVLEAVRPDSSIFDWTDNIGDDSPEVGLFKYAFPFHDFRATSREPYVTSLDLTSDAGQWGLVLELEALRLLDGAAGYYYGAAASVNGYVRGRARLAAWASMGKAWDTELAHEVGHNLGLRHAPCGGAGGADPEFPHAGGSIGAWGIDFRDGSLVSPHHRRDIMGYCYDQGWLSDYYFEKVIDYRARVEGERARTAAAGARESDVLVLWGGVTGGELRIEPPFPARAPALMPQGGGPYRLEGLGTGGAVLFSHSFTPGEDQYGDRYFLFAIPAGRDWEASLERIVLTGPEGEAVAAATDGRTVTVYTDRATGRVRGILRDWRGAPPAALGPVEALEATTTYRN